LRIALLLLLTACATTPKAPPLAAPQWDVVPPAVLDVLCSRLQMDAIATTGSLAIVDTTRPLANQQSLSALSVMARGRVKGERIGTSAAEANRAIPLMTTGTACPWRPIRVEDLQRYRDEMVVELSAPAINPFSPKEGGLFVRVALGGENPSWYWVELVHHGDRWSIGFVHVLVQ